MTEQQESQMILRLFLVLLVLAIGAAALALCCGAEEPAASEEASEETAEAEPVQQQEESAELVLLTEQAEVLPTDDPSPLPVLTVQATEDGLETGDAETEAQEAQSYNGITEGDVIAGTLTFYDVCLACCGKTDGITASGLQIQNGMEDPHIISCNWLPLGAVVTIDGVTYTVADRGGTALDTVGRVDVFVPAGHQAALELGRVEAEIAIISLY